MCWGFCKNILLSTILFSLARPTQALTTIQTSTSMGYYRDYLQTSHYPIFHSWSLHGFYETGVETSIDFLLNNDFATNKWAFFPTQAAVTVPLSKRFSKAPERQSHLKLGRQLFSEGFEMSFLDGAQLPLFWSETGGLMPFGGELRSPDLNQTEDSGSPLVGVVAWESFFDFQTRVGYSAQDENMRKRYFFAGVVRQFPDLLWTPQLLIKQEWDGDHLAFNQQTSDLSFIFSDKWSGRVGYSNLQPRPTHSKLSSPFLYPFFATSPTESLNTDLTWECSESLQLAVGAERSFFRSGLQNEVADRQDLSAVITLIHGQQLTPAYTHISSYGGTVDDLGLRYSFNLSSETRTYLEYNLAYANKINKIKGWLQHARGGYELRIADRAKALFTLEAERNQYFEFDVRTMAYVTNYL